MVVQVSRDEHIFKILKGSEFVSCAFHSDDSVRVIPKETVLNDTNQSIVPSPISWTMGWSGPIMLLLETS